MTTKKTKKPTKAKQPAPAYEGTVARTDGRRVRVTVPGAEPVAPKAAPTPASAKDATRANTAAPKAKRAKPAPVAPQDHEVPSAKEVTNNARLEAHAKTVIAKGKPPKPPHVSALNAAVLVLASAPAEGLSAKAMVEQMVAQKLWSSPKGKTPEASLYAAIIREIGRKGKAARFRKVDRGRFVLTQPPA
jgi:hypothetical protein